MILFRKQIDLSSYRYERKYLVEHLSLPEIKQLCLFHPNNFKKVYYPRFINNIYFDTLGYEHLVDNIEGEKNRLKIRIRWYGNLYGNIEKPVLEFKVKNGLLGTKYSYKLPPFILDKSFNKRSFIQLIKQSGLPEQVKNELLNLEPTLLNRYHRFYYLSFNKKFRLTIDSELSFHKISFNNPISLEKSALRNGTVVELKYSPEVDEEAREVSTYFPFPLTKNSKYIQGIDRLLN